MKQKSHKRSENVEFHDIGLWATNKDAFDPRQDVYVHDDQTWKVRTLTSIKRMLGHQGRVIAVLKLDIEGYEWDIVDNLIETGMFKFIRQFILEWHIFKDLPTKAEYVRIYKVSWKTCQKQNINIKC